MFLRGRLKRVKNLYMAGQWLMPPGGLPVAILTGRWAIQRICQVEKQPWRCSN
jgi:phytoene dehydrogenase-like protein